MFNLLPCNFYKAVNAGHAQLANELAILLISVLITAPVEQAAKAILDLIYADRAQRAARRDLARSSMYLDQRQALFFDESVNLFLERINSHFQNILNYIRGDTSHSNTRSCTVLFIGPPGCGKTASACKFLQEIKKIVKDYAKKNITIGLSDYERKYILKARERALEGTLIKEYFFVGSFFARYMQYSETVLRSFFENVQELLQDGYIVFIAIDEIDYLMNQAENGQRSQLATEFLYAIDELNRLLNQENCPGRLILIGTTNGGGAIDYAILRRIAENIYAFSHPEAKIQKVIFQQKLSSYLQKEQKRKNIDLARFRFNLQLVLDNISESVDVFVEYGINFTGAAVENIMKNTFSVLLCMSEEKIKVYGEKIEDQVINIIKDLMMEESLKILKIEQRKFAADITNIFNKIYAKINLYHLVPHKTGGYDWGMAAA